MNINDSYMSSLPIGSKYKAPADLFDFNCYRKDEYEIMKAFSKRTEYDHDIAIKIDNNINIYQGSQNIKVDNEEVRMFIDRDGYSSTKMYCNGLWVSYSNLLSDGIWK